MLRRDQMAAPANVTALLAAAALVIVTAIVPAAGQQSRRPAKPPALDPVELAAAIPQPTACSRGYHRALAARAQTFPDDFARTLALLRQPIADLATRWHFNETKAPLDWATLTPAKGRPVAIAPTGGRCAAFVVTAETAGCQISGEPTPGSGVSTELTNLPATPRRATDDRVQRLLEVYHRAGGMAPETQSDGKFFWPLERVAADLSAYVSQPETAMICTGAPEMLDFIAEQIAGPTRRHLAVLQVANVAGEQALRAIDDVPRGRPHTPFAPLVDPAALLRRAAELSLPDEAIAAMAAQPALNARLRIAAQALKALPPAEAASIRPAFAAVELFAFAAHMASRYGAYDRAYTGSIATLRAAHRQACSCGE